MSKVKILLSSIFLLTLFAFAFINQKAILAACQCANWDCHDEPQWDVHPYGITQVCTCSEQNCTGTQSCGPGTYVCNNASGCCNIGTPPTGGGGGGSCTQTAITNMSVTRTSSTSAVLNWTPGANSTYQALWVSTNSDPEVGCAGSTGGTAVCPVRLDAGTTPLPSTTSTYAITNLLSPGTVYYWRMMNVQSSTCFTRSNSLYLSSCTASPSSYSLTTGQTQLLSWTTPVSSGIQSVTFTSNPTYISLSAASDATSPYDTTMTALSPTGGTPTTVTSDFYLTGGILSCSASTSIAIASTPAWWQVKDGDVTTNGSLTSQVPTSQLFGTIGSGGFPGVPVYGTTFNLSSSTTKISTPRWYVNSTTSTERLFDYSYFENLIPATTVINDISTLASGGTSTFGYEWYKVTGNIDIDSNIDFGSRKVILFVESGNLNVNARINLTDNAGFFGAFVDGNIAVNSAVTGTPAMEGVYLSDGNFSSGIGVLPIHIRGSVASFGTVNLQRDLTTNLISPAELIEFAPDQIMLFPEKLGFRGQKWSEVAP